MGVLVNLAGAPSVGKSSIAAKLFAKLKDMGKECELATEYCKGWVWDKREITHYSQLYFFGKQSYAESHLFNKVDFIISDSPTFLSGYYNEHNNHDTSLNEACKGFYKKAEEDGIKVFNFFLPRTRPYNPLGRFQSEEQSDAIAIELREWLDREGYPYIYLDCPDNKRIDIILQHLREAGVLNE